MRSHDGWRRARSPRSSALPWGKSSTIDPERFSEHFDGAPIIEVSGRAFPVEVRYREPTEGVDQTDAIGDAVDELLREGKANPQVAAKSSRASARVGAGRGGGA
jgi:HrpA-like RNA helicase